MYQACATRAVEYVQRTPGHVEARTRERTRSRSVPTLLCPSLACARQGHRVSYCARSGVQIMPPCEPRDLQIEPCKCRLRRLRCFGSTWQHLPRFVSTNVRVLA